MKTNEEYSEGLYRIHRLNNIRAIVEGGYFAMDNVKNGKLLTYQRCLEAFAVILVFTLVAVTTYQVFGRYVLHKTPVWSEELAKIILVWLTFLGAAIAFGKGTHLKIDLLESKLSKKMSVILNLIVDLLIILFLIIICINCYEFMSQISGRLTPALRIPSSVSYFGLFFGFIASLPFIITSIVHSIKQLKGGIRH